MFLDLEKWERGKTAIIDDSGYTLTYGDLTDMVEEFRALGLPRCVVFSLCENCAGSLVGYIAFESNRQVPLLLSANLDKELLANLDKTYQPSYYWAPERMAQELGGNEVLYAYGYVLLKANHTPYPFHEDLSLLLTTSGSTGSPKLVRHKYGNLEANARNVAKVFNWRPDERGICDLPMNYTMGLNVINSHLVVGATVLMVKRNLMDPDFYAFIKEQRGTSFCGVPFSYDIIRRAGIAKMELPDLYTLAEGGGKLTDKMFKWVTEYCESTGKRFCATFGTTETSARMAFLPPTMATKKVGSIGKAIPEGELFLMDESEQEEGYSVGELCYRGPNVTMGYAQCREELRKGDEFCGEYHTGDIARRDSDGFYYIIGRKSRFLKLFGMRVGLDESEQIIKTRFSCECACAGDDSHMIIFITESVLANEVRTYISEKTKIHISAFRVVVLEEIPRNEYGKVNYTALNNMI